MLSMRSVIGKLVRMDFAERKGVLFYAPAGRMLECTYSADSEEVLLDNPREMVRVTGDVIVDDAGFPERIVDVEGIEDLDLSPITLEAFAVRGEHLRLREAVVLFPELDESQEYLILRDEVLGIDVFAPTREDLLGELEDDLKALWIEYALADPERLTPGARALRDAWLALVVR